jgi:hypothetical protein
MGQLRSVGRVKLPSVPGPSDVLAAMGGVRDGVADTLALVPRIGSAIGRMEDLLVRVGTVLTRVEGIVDRADEAVRRIDATQSKADEAFRRIDATQSKADEAFHRIDATQSKADAAIEAIGATQGRADDAVVRTENLVGRMDPLLGAYEQPLTALAPSFRRLAATLEPHEVEAMVKLVDQLPQLVTHLEEDIFPVLESLGAVGTDVHDLVDTVQDLRQVMKGFPGSKLFRRRGAEEIAQEDDDEAREITGT